MSRRNNGLVKVVDELAEDEPILVTDKVRILLDNIKRAGRREVGGFYGTTRDLERESPKSRDTLEILYARRLLVALYYENLDCVDADADLRCRISYDQASKWAQYRSHRAKSRSVIDEKRAWQLRSFLAKLMAADIAEDIGNPREAFYSSVGASEIGIGLIRDLAEEEAYDVVIEDWDYEGILEEVGDAITLATAFRDRGLPDDVERGLLVSHEGLVRVVGRFDPDDWAVYC